MTTKIDIEECRQWLYEQPCPDGARCPVSNCKTYGLAFPWASEKCDRTPMNYPNTHPQWCMCKGSGRVPKAIGLSLIIVESQKLGCYDAIADAVTKQVLSKWSTEDEITLAALQAMVKSQQKKV